MAVSAGPVSATASARRDARAAASGPPVPLVDPSGQQFTVQATSGFQSVPVSGPTLTLAIANPTAAAEGIDIKDMQLSVFALIGPADQTTFENALDAVGDYDALTCAGQPVTPGYANPVPAGRCGVDLSVGPDSDVPTMSGGETAIVPPHTTVHWDATLSAAPGVPVGDITTVLVGFSPDYQPSVQLAIPPSNIPIPALPPSRIPAGTWTCRAKPVSFPHPRVALQPGDRVTGATLSTGGPARQLQVVFTFDGPVTTGSKRRLYQFDVPLESGSATTQSLGATFRRGQTPAAALLTHGTSDTDVDAVARGERLTVRVPLLGLTKLAPHFRWQVTETVLAGAHQTKAFTTTCGPVTT